jgi:hypothetical protein
MPEKQNPANWLQSHFKDNLKSAVTGRLTVTRTGVEPVTLLRRRQGNLTGTIMLWYDCDPWAGPNLIPLNVTMTERPTVTGTHCPDILSTAASDSRALHSVTQMLRQHQTCCCSPCPLWQIVLDGLRLSQPKLEAYHVLGRATLPGPGRGRLARGVQIH